VLILTQTLSPGGYKLGLTVLKPTAGIDLWELQMVPHRDKNQSAPTWWQCITNLSKDDHTRRNAINHGEIKFRLQSCTTNEWAWR